MSESAFAAYKKAGTSSLRAKSTPAKKAAAKAKAATKAKSTGTAKKTAAAPKAKVTAAAKSKATVDKAKPTAEKQKPKATNAKATKTEKAPAAPAKARKSTGGAGASNGIKPSEVDKLAKELLGSNSGKLSKAQEKKKKELEDYLVRQLKNDDAAGSGSGSDDDDEFSDEYTINTTTGSFSDSDDDSQSGSGDSGSESESDAEDESGIGAPNGLAFDLKAIEKSKSAPKRKNATTTKATKGGVAADAKKSRKSLPAKQVARCEPEPQKMRRSLGASTSAAAAAANGVEPNFCKRVVAGGQCGVGDVGGGTMTATTAAPMKLEPLSPPTNAVTMNSIDEGLKAFRWLLNPIAVDDFFGKYWEKNACLVKRKQSNYFANLISFEAIDQMLLKHHVEFTKNIDVTSYKNGVRETLNPEGRAMPPVVWDHYGQGCSIRLLNPQTFMPALFTLSTTLQEYFHCLVGANAYLTPPNSQGFAPHYDDIEAFVLQIEGRKRWRLYKPRTQAEMLPRFSSPNFAQHEIGEPILEEVLQPGDVLYFPRGTIHQAFTEPGYHSLHITLSVYQKQSFADLFERMMPLILQRAIASSVDMRRGVPLSMWQHAGIAYADTGTRERAALLSKTKQLMAKCLQAVPLDEMLDAAVDQLAKKFQHEALPPEVLAAERIRTVFGSRSTRNERGECVCDYEIELRSNVRLLRANIIRLVQEADGAAGAGEKNPSPAEGSQNGGAQRIRIYYYVDNSKEYCEYAPNFIEIEAEEAASVEVLIKSYPAYVGVSQLPLADDERKLQVVTALWERGLLMLEKPFK